MSHLYDRGKTERSNLISPKLVMKVPLFKSLKFRMPALVSMGVIPFIVLAILYASDRAAKTIRTEADENLELKANLLAESVSRWEESNVLALLTLSEQPSIISMNPESQQPVLSGIAKQYQHIYLAATTNKDGYYVTRSDNNRTPEEGGYRGKEPWFETAIKGQNLSRQVLISKTNDKPALCLSAPIRQNNSTVIGVTVICTDLEILAKQVGQLKVGETGYAFVVDRSGTVLAHPNQEYLSGEQLKNLKNFLPVKHLLSKKDGPFPFKDDRDVNWMSYGRRLENGWGVVVLQEEREFFKSQREFERSAFFLAIVMVIGVSLLIGILANRIIAPITNLTNAASAIANGEFSRKIKIERTDELGILANSFNQMGANLKSLFENLEQRIEERTAQLKQAKENAEQAKEEAEAATVVKDKFLINISHELRTPLNAVIGYAKILQHYEERNDKIIGLRIIQQSGTHLLSLINDLLDFAKSKASKIQLDLEELYLVKFLEEVVGIVEMSAKEKSLGFEYEVSGELPPKILADSKRLRQVLLNLLSNAVKFTDKGKVIFKVIQIPSLKESSTQQTIRFEVIDTGVGMSPSSLEKIFQPFEQVGDLDRRSAGTGLGLSITAELVQLMGSSIQVDSELGVGSTFWFDVTFETVPLADVVPFPASNQQITGYYGSKSYLILVIDDRPENRSLLRNILEPIGFRVEEADNGYSGLEMVKTLKPDLILTDLLMPVKTGLRMVLELREMPEFQEIPIIGLSASTTDVMENKSRNFGCDAFMSKPIDEEKLLSLLQHYLQLKWSYSSINSI